MLRLAEIGLFLLPIGLFVMWRVLTPHVRPVLLWIAMGCVMLLAGIAIGFGLRERMDPHSRYVPAHIEDGKIIQGTGVP